MTVKYSTHAIKKSKGFFCPPFGSSGAGSLRHVRYGGASWWMTEGRICVGVCAGVSSHISHQEAELAGARLSPFNASLLREVRRPQETSNLVAWPQWPKALPREPTFQTFLPSAEHTLNQNEIWKIVKPHPNQSSYTLLFRPSEPLLAIPQLSIPALLAPFTVFQIGPPKSHSYMGFLSPSD